MKRLLQGLDLLNYTLFLIIVKSTKNKTVRCYVHSKIMKHELKERHRGKGNNV